MLWEVCLSDNKVGAGQRTNSVDRLWLIIKGISKLSTWNFDDLLKLSLSAIPLDS